MQIPHRYDAQRPNQSNLKDLLYPKGQSHQCNQKILGAEVPDICRRTIPATQDFAFRLIQKKPSTGGFFYFVFKMLSVF
jgi:hypothetical protein